MQSCETKNNGDSNKVPVSQLISSKEIESAFRVGRRTVRKWAKQYEWKEFRFSHKVLRYLKHEVEDSMGVDFGQGKEED